MAEHTLCPYLELGTVVGTHGLQGELRVQPQCDSPAFCRQFKRLYWDPAGQTPVELQAVREHKQTALLRLAGITTPQAAAAVRGRTLYFARSDATLAPGQYYIADLLGCGVYDADTPERCYGTLSDVTPGTKANDVWHVAQQGQEHLVPVINEVVCHVDVAKRRIEIRPLPGLFDENER